jgi:penicillin-binding protein 2
MDQDIEKQERFTRRAFIIGAGQGVALAILGGKLAWLQIAEGDKYTTLAENNRINVRILPPSRGQIVDRFGVPLAVNLQNFQVLVIPEQVPDLETALRSLQSVVAVDEKDMKRALRDAKRNPRFVPIEIRDRLTWDEVSAIEVRIPDLPGVSIQAGELRSYPYKEATAHLIGYVGRVSEQDKMSDPLLSLPGFQIGKSGIEKLTDLDLRGTPGKAEIEVNVHGREVRQLGRNPGQNGKRIMLTIDAELQRMVQQRLAQERSASAVVMDVQTGAVYALASHPSFDPNNFSGGISAMDWEQLRDDPAHPLNNKAAGGLYPPGSTFKMVTALAGLESGMIDKNWSVFCPGHFELGKTRFHCWKAGGHGTVNLERAIAESCDVYFYKLATMIGIDRIAKMAREMGLGEKPGTGLPEEKSGLVPDQKWKREERQEPWHPGETVVTAIGQGSLQASPLQLATMISRLVNGGIAVRPWVVAYADAKAVGENLSGKNWPVLEVDPGNLLMIRKGMEKVLLPGGTAFSSRIQETGMEMGGKTGTSQVKRITKAERAAGIKQDSLPWHYRHHALFVGFAPTSNPRYACAVVVEHGGSGSGAAAPIAHDILLETQKRNPADKKMETE